MISEEDKNYVYKVTPSIEQLSSIVHVFPLGDALEKDSVQIFSQIFMGVQVVRTPAEAQKFKMVIAPKIEEFSFRYDEGKGSYSDIRFIVPTASIKVKTTLYREGIQIWEKSIKSPEQRKTTPYNPAFTSENEMGEVASQALNYALKKTAEEIVQDPEVEKNAANIPLDRRKKTYAQQKLIIPLRRIVVRNRPPVNLRYREKGTGKKVPFKSTTSSNVYKLSKPAEIRSRQGKRKSSG